MPCPMCRKHFREWRTTHSFEELMGGAEASRRWLWNLHEDVNGRREIPVESRIPFEELERMYGIAARRREDLQQDIDILMKVFQSAVLHRQADGAVLRAWRGKLEILRRLMGL